MRRWSRRIMAETHPVDRARTRTMIGGIERLAGGGGVLRIVVLAAGLAAGLATSVASASPSITVTMPVGGVVNVSAPGIVQADVAPAGVAGAWAAGDHVIVWGVRQGTATLVMTSPDGIEARPVQVMPANSAQALFGQRTCSAPLAASVTSSANAAATAAYTPPNTNVMWSPGEWQALWNFHGSDGGRFTAADTLNTPLAMLGIPRRAGVDVTWDRWDVVANQSVAALAYEMPLGSAMMMELGDTTLGPIGEATAAAGDVSVSSLALVSQSGEWVAATQTTLTFGPFAIGYLAGPNGGVPSLQYRAGSFMLSASNWPGEGTSLGLNVWLKNGTSVEGTWGQQAGWTAQVEVPLGPGRAPGKLNSASALTGVVLPDGSCGWRAGPLSAPGRP